MDEEMEKRFEKVEEQIDATSKAIDNLSSSILNSSNDKIVDFELKLKMFKYRAEYSKGMAKFIQQVTAPKKNGHVDYTSKKGRTKYDYVTLDDLISSIQKGIKGTGLSWQQEVESNNGVARVRTIITHENGYQYISPWVAFKSASDPQSVASVITYAKRYSLSTTFGINSEPDDDAQQAEAMQNSRQRSSNNNSGNYTRNSKTASRRQPVASRMDTKQVGLANDLINSISETNKKPVNEIRSQFLAMFGVKMFSDLDHHKGDQLIDVLTRQLEKMNNEAGDGNDK